MKKKPTSIRLQIPEPCTQSFDQMHPLPGGRYCDKCEKTVVDFTDMSDGELVRIYQKRQGRVCGVFRSDQLNRSVPLPMILEKNRTWKAVAAFASALLFGNVAAGQMAEDHSSMTKEELFIRGINSPKANDLQIINGKVTDENGVPLIGAYVIIGSNKGTATDVDGNFELEIPASVASQKITFSYLGFEDKEIVWKKGQILDIQLGEVAKDLPIVEVTALNQFVKGKLICGVCIGKNDWENSNEEIIEVEQVSAPILEVFPNPFVSYINVKIELEQPETVLFHLYNEAGQLLYAETSELTAGTQTIQLNLSQRVLPEGIYFLRISDSIGEIRTKRVVKVNP